MSWVYAEGRERFRASQATRLKGIVTTSCSRLRCFAFWLGFARNQRTLQVPHRLFQTLVVLHQRDANRAFAVLPKRPTRRESHLRLVHHPQAEIDRPLRRVARPEVLRVDLRPDEHRRPRLLVSPP